MPTALSISQPLRRPQIAKMESWLEFEKFVWLAEGAVAQSSRAVIQFLDYKKSVGENLGRPKNRNFGFCWGVRFFKDSCPWTWFQYMCSYICLSFVCTWYLGLLLLGILYKNLPKKRYRSEIRLFSKPVFCLLVISYSMWSEPLFLGSVIPYA